MIHEIKSSCDLLYELICKFQVADATACDKYILCVNGIETPKTCDLGDHFNAATSDCDTPANALCTIVSNACSSATAAAPYVADTSVADCTKYIVCVDQLQTELKTCAVGLFFDVTQQRCSSKFICPA